MISERHYSRLAKLIADTNGEVIIGGKTIPENQYIEPTVITNVKMDDPIMKDEIFGPILPIVEVQSLEEAINVVKKDEKPLASYCFGMF